MVIITDTREQRPFSFLGAAADVAVEVGALPCGDYSLKGLETKCAVERKSLSDLIQSISGERDRFFRELDRARGLEAFAIVCEGSWDDLVQGRYRSKMGAAAAAATVTAIMARYGVPVFFAGSKALAERFTVLFLRQYLRGKQHEVEAVKAAMADNAAGRGA